MIRRHKTKQLEEKSKDMEEGFMRNNLYWIFRNERKMTNKSCLQRMRLEPENKILKCWKTFWPDKEVYDDITITVPGETRPSSSHYTMFGWLSRQWSAQASGICVESMSDKMAYLLLKICNTARHQEKLPTDKCIGIINPIHKKCCKVTLSNLRTLSLIFISDMVFWTEIIDFHLSNQQLN